MEQTFHISFLQFLIDMSEVTAEQKKKQEDPCSDTYQGTKPFSEVETRNIRDFLTKVPVLSLAFHSFGQMFLWPYGYSIKPAPYNLKDLKEMSRNAVKAINDTIVNGTEFDVWEAKRASGLCKSFNLQI